jgi:pimeloyl-ACP methyl ester carboxylesterase
MRSTLLRSSRWLAPVVALVALLGVPYAWFKIADPERLELNDTVRASAPGRFVRLTDGYTHYDLSGPSAAPIVVLVAGFSVPYYIWDPTFDALVGAGFRVLRYDYYGRGFSDRPDVPYTDEFYVRQLKELLDAVKISRPVHLTGLSMGAAVVTSFADRYPDRVRSLIYFDPSFRSPHPTSWLEERPAVWNFVTTITEQPLWAESQLEDFFHPERFADWPARYQVQMQYRGFRRARLSEIVNNAEGDQAVQLQRVSAHPRPVLIVWGKEDKAVPFAQSEALLEIMPGARLLPVESAGHLPQIEQPAVVNPGIIEFLRSVESKPLMTTR